MNDIELAELIAARVAEKGGRVYYVGGYVRDGLLGRESKDVDIEVHGIYPGELTEILKEFGTAIGMGDSFGIYGIAGHGLDIAMPRKEKTRGAGHRDLDVFVDPFVGLEGAASRRDFTFNSMMRDVLTGELIDPFRGREDLEAGVVRHVNDATFAEDPLRALRCAAFAARFGFSVATETLELCKSINVSALSRERVNGELKKALLMSETPSVFFEVLRKAELLGSWFCELEPLCGLMQDKRYHLEGDVWRHTMLVLDAAAGLKDGVEDPYAFMLAALCHDMGKPLCTERVGNAVHSYGHEMLGLPVAEKFLRRLTNEKRLISHTLNLVEHHMKPNALATSKASAKSMNRMFDTVYDAEALVRLAIADSRGQIKADGSGDNGELLYAALNVYRENMSRPYVTGKDLIDAGVEQGTGFSELLAYAHKLRLAGVDKDSAMKQTLAFARKLKRKKP